MDEGDVLHMIILDETGTPVTIELIGGTGGVEDGTAQVPVATDATLIIDTVAQANWLASSFADGYYLDVATDSLFTSFVSGYENLDVGDVLSYSVTGLSGETDYYYRLRAYNDVGTSDNSNTIGFTTTEVGGYYTVLAGTSPGGLILKSLDSGLTFSSEGTPYSLSTYSDWFLPSLDELQLMYDNLHVFTVGGFANLSYWSSTEYEVDPSAYLIDFADGYTSASDNKSTDGARIRACRSFTSTEIYALRATGPADGLIFYIVDNGDATYTYYEAAPSDQGVSTWSNIETLLGTTSSSVGEGQNNTNEIIAQSGHTNSAAKICNDLGFTAGEVTCFAAYGNGDVICGTTNGYVVNYTRNSYKQVGNYSITALETYYWLGDQYVLCGDSNGDYYVWDDAILPVLTTSIGYQINAIIFTESIFLFTTGGIFGVSGALIQAGNFTCACSIADGDPSNPSLTEVVYAGDAAGHVWKTLDYGETWIDKGLVDASGIADIIEIADSKIMCVDVESGDPSDPSVSGNSVYISDDGFDTSTEYTIGNSDNALALNYVEGNIVLMGDEGGNIWRSTDNGVTWVEIAGNPQQGETSINCMISSLTDYSPSSIYYLYDETYLVDDSYLV